MIVDIKKGGFAKGLIEYHERKIEKGRGTRLMDTTLSQNKEQRIARILDTANANPSKKLKNKFAHISISFAKGENLPPETQMKIAERYLREMGYWNCPRVLYEHHDTAHRHFHIVTTTIDLEGKKVPDLKDYRRSKELSRVIEKEFGLQVTEYAKQEQQKLQEVNAKKFGLYKGLEKIVNDPNAQEQLAKIISPDEQDQILSSKLPDTEVSNLLKLRDAEANRIQQLYRVIRQFDAEYKTDKEKLREQLTYIKSLASSRDQFMALVEKQGLYIRKISQSNGTSYLTYGFPTQNFYVSDKDLPIALRYEYLFTERKVTQSFDPESQKRFLKTMITKSLRKSSTLEEFEQNLKTNGINFSYASNKRGVYGISFSSENLKDAITFKGSEIGIGWNKLVKDLSIQPVGPRQQEEKKTKQETPDNSLHIPKNLSRSLDTSNDDEEKKKKRKDQDQEMNPD